ncbi:type II toxin-antitoxin system RelE/ParE family toxin [Cecembia lonarensis]|uniref:Plasmid stabilization system protein n=1 Tax=Cecembia lonarensis (strain CCUG 58316 / KCTC 22772 / LW9) TaxID=1225176 RepID=K1KXS0_CECL9|nr:type II toxin-antitoxin system RelE/ParE family toxin [Cecembia lonarensis]EKB48915.1 Plasmid stabilization system protein [Cecembia lonarensis LW9]
MVKRKVKVVWANEAKEALKQIYLYIKNRQSIDVAKKVRDEIVSQTKTLGDFPEKFEKEHYLLNAEGDFRYKVVWSYKIIYEVASEAVYVLDVFHTSRDPSNIKKTS